MDLRSASAEAGGRASPDDDRPPLPWTGGGATPPGDREADGDGAARARAVARWQEADRHARELTEQARTAWRAFHAHRGPRPSLQLEQQLLQAVHEAQQRFHDILRGA